MKRYVLGNYELEAFELDLLRKAVRHEIKENENFIDSCYISGYSKEYYKKENAVLTLMLKELERYWD